MKRARIYVIYGQGGWLTSIGMSNLATRLAKLFPDSVVTTHNCRYPGALAADMRRQPATVPKIPIGYSLGACDVTMAGNLAPDIQIDLGVCYDPSRSGQVENPGPNIKRLLLYHNVGDGPIGHAIFKGPQVERTDVDSWHLAVCYNEALHLKTIDAVRKVVS